MSKGGEDSSLRVDRRMNEQTSKVGDTLKIPVNPLADSGAGEGGVHLWCDHTPC